MTKITSVLCLCFTFYGTIFGQDVDPNGYLFGEVSLRSGTQYRGILRWGKEEASWSDLFHSSKGAVPFRSYISGDKDERKNLKIFGFNISTSSWNVQAERLFVAQFGDIAEIRPHGEGKADVVMKSGRIYSVEGYANDVETDLHITDQSLGQVTVPWQKIDKITFTNGKLPRGTYAKRLYGSIETPLETFEGFIQWDHEECIGTDKLDGENENGSFSIPFERIRTIEKLHKRSVKLTLVDDRTLTLRGTNDVNSSNRGIYVDDPRFGKVDIDWAAFMKANFEWRETTGPDYDQYEKGFALQATTVDRDGNKHSGFLAYDLDEMESWEFLNGRYNDIEYYIPFAKIERIKPRGSHASEILLHNETSLTLEDHVDVSRKNLGVLLLERPSDRKGHFTPWDEVKTITLKRE